MKTIEEIKTEADSLVAQLERWEDAEERGVLAKLRQGMNPTMRSRSFIPLGAAFGAHAIESLAYRTVTTSFAVHPCKLSENFKVGDMGWTLREIFIARSGKPRNAAIADIRNPKEGHPRLARLLACRTREELASFILQAVKLSKATDKRAVNYRALYKDIVLWGERVQIRWARSFYDVSAEEIAPIKP
jgi:CRISPR type I-E-associated protein CasB/Cse2